MGPTFRLTAAPDHRPTSAGGACACGCARGGHPAVGRERVLFSQLSAGHQRYCKASSRHCCPRVAEWRRRCPPLRVWGRGWSSGGVVFALRRCRCTPWAACGGACRDRCAAAGIGSCCRRRSGAPARLHARALPARGGFACRWDEGASGGADHCTQWGAIRSGTRDGSRRRVSAQSALGRARAASGRPSPRLR